VAAEAERQRRQEAEAERQRRGQKARGKTPKPVQDLPDDKAQMNFTDPELARSGLTEAQARGKYGSKIRVYRADYAKLDRARTERATDGLAKFVCDARGKILGIHILGQRAGEVLHEAHAARTLGIPLHKLNEVIHTYPTYSELTRLAARAAYIDRIASHPVVRLVKWLRGSK